MVIKTCFLSLKLLYARLGSTRMGAGIGKPVVDPEFLNERNTKGIET